MQENFSYVVATVAPLMKFSWFKKNFLTLRKIFLYTDFQFLTFLCMSGGKKAKTILSKFFLLHKKNFLIAKNFFLKGKKIFLTH